MFQIMPSARTKWRQESGHLAKLERLSATLTTPGVEPGLSRPRRDVLTTRRCGRLSLQCLTAVLSNVTVSRQDMGRLFWIQGQCPRWQTLEFI